MSPVSSTYARRRPPGPLTNPLQTTPPRPAPPPHAEAALPSGLRVLWDTEETVRSFHPDWNRGHLKPWDAFWGQRYAVVPAPDGCGVSLFADAA